MTKEMQDILSLISPVVQDAPAIRIRLNVGMLIDIPTGEYYRTPTGRWILNGGLHQTLGISGLPNTFKSTFMMTITVRAVNRLIENNVPTQITTMDTETTLERQRLQHLVNSQSALAALDPMNTGVWVLTTSNQQDGTDWWAAVRRAAKTKMKSAKKLMVKTPYFDGMNKPIEVLLPTFNHLDSITAFKSKDTEELDDKVELGDSKGLMLYMKAGLAKARFLTTLSSLAERANLYFMLSAHVGEAAADVSSGPSYMNRPDKKMPTMKANQRYKGVTDNYFSLLGGIWQTHRVTPMYSDKKPMYPVDSSDTRELDTDLQCITMQLMRSKSSGDGIIIEQVMSKTEGFLPSLTEFHYIKSNDRYGLPGNDQWYVCALYPDVKLSRSTVRAKLSDPRLQRAITICSEMLQIKIHRKCHVSAWIISPEQLYDALLDKGYSWNKILDSRGWHSLGTPPAGILTVTTMDLLAIAAGELDLPEFKLETADAT